MDLMLMLDLNEALDKLDMANSVHWCVHVFRWKDGYVLKRSLQFEIGGQRKKGRIEKKCEKQVKD